MTHNLRLDQYLACLDRLHGLVAAWERHSLLHAPGWLADALLARSRQSMLERDLQYLGSAPRLIPGPVISAAGGLPALLGAMYVMEGSTLGGQLIARHVEQALGLMPGVGDAYFRGHQTQTGPMWQAFCTVLRDRVPEDQTSAVIEGAKVMFQVFGAWMSPHGASA